MTPTLAASFNQAIPSLDSMLDDIAHQVQLLLDVSGVFVLLADEAEQTFFVSTALLGHGNAKIVGQTVRFPVDEGLSGKVYATGRPQIVLRTQSEDYATDWLYRHLQGRRTGLLLVPLRFQEHTIGVLGAADKQQGDFGDNDVAFLTAVAKLVALPIENVRINQSLARAYEDVRGLNKIKAQAMHHLSHEMKTPISVLSACLSLLEKRLSDKPPAGWQRIMRRARRNLKRLLDLQYEIGDLLTKAERQQGLQQRR